MFRPVSFLLAVSLLVVIALPAVAQVPQISKRTFSGGTAKLKVTGSFAVDEEIGINKQASIADDGQTWSLVADNIPANARNYLWTPLADPNSARCRMRILRTDYNGWANIKKWHAG